MNSITNKEKVTSEVPIKKLAQKDYKFSSINHIKLDTIQMTNDAIKSLFFHTDCVVHFSLSTDVSHAHVHFYANDIEQLIRFEEFLNSSDYLYLS